MLPEYEIRKCQRCGQEIYLEESYLPGMDFSHQYAADVYRDSKGRAWPNMTGTAIDGSEFELDFPRAHVCVSMIERQNAAISKRAAAQQPHDGAEGG